MKTTHEWQQDKVRIVLIETSHPGNIGAAARAMKVMGLVELYLVSPKHFPDPQAIAMASGADDVLQNATVVSHLSEAITDCHIVIGTSARSQRYLQWPLRTARECGEYIAEQDEGKKIAIIFGRERTGLTNDELDYCQSLVHIPTNPDYHSLNVAAAVQLMSYEYRIHQNQTQSSSPEYNESRQELPVNQNSMEGFYQHLEKILAEIRYLDPDNPRYLMRRLRRLFGRVDIVPSEMNILRGILSAMQGRKFKVRDKKP
jgi:TrmH family RNA methyltransferase